MLLHVFVSLLKVEESHPPESHSVKNILILVFYLFTYHLSFNTEISFFQMFYQRNGRTVYFCSYCRRVFHEECNVRQACNHENATPGRVCFEIDILFLHQVLMSSNICV